MTGPVVGLYAVRAALVGGIFLVLLVGLLNLQRDNTSGAKTSDMLIASLNVERSMVGLETGLRGYLLTREPAFLAPYAQAQAVLPTQMAALQRDTQSAAERAQVTSINQGIGVYVTKYARPLIAARGRLTHRQLVFETALDRRLIDGLRSQFSALDTAAVSTRMKRRVANHSGVRTAIVLAAIGLGLSLLLEVGLAGFLLRGVLGPIRAVTRAAARLATGDLTTRVPRTGTGEVAVLSDSFNTMAQAIETRNDDLAFTQERLVQAALAAEEASAMKSNFVANMSHEIRTPLNGVLGMLTLLSETPLNEEQRRLLEVAMSSSDALMSVVGDVLDIAKIEAGRLEIEQRDFDLHDTVEAVCDLAAGAAREKQIELQAFVHDDVPRAVRGDRTRVAQVLQNLVTNAVKFTHSGEVAVEVSLGRRGGSRIDVLFEVRDTGIGIERERVPHLFEPFSQADAGTTRRFGGTGLGLAISRELTRLMDGEISGESELGKGSVFRFRVPFAPARAPVAAPLPAADLYGLRVLVVDDNATNRQVFQAYTSAWGMRPEATDNGTDALNALRDASNAGDPFHVALLDLNLDGESGIDLARRITASPELGDTRLILLTSSSARAVEDPSAGIRERLTKPVRQSGLLDAIGAAMAAEGAPRPEPAAPASVPAIPASPLHRILVAEDHRVNWMLIEQLLLNRGYTADNAEDGVRALEMLQEGSYDLVLMDCQMPELDGYDTTREVRRREAAGALPGHVSVVAMTANAMSGAREECLSAGMDDYITKPISAAELDEVLARWLPSSSARPGEDEERLDPERVAELRRLFPGERATEVLQQMADEAAGDLDAIEAAAQSGDRAGVAAAAHRIRNTGRVIGAQRLSDAAAALDRPLLPGAEPGPAAEQIDHDAVERLRGCWEAAHAAIEAELARSAV